MASHTTVYKQISYISITLSTFDNHVILLIDYLYSSLTIVFHCLLNFMPFGSTAASICEHETMTTAECLGYTLYKPLSSESSRDLVVVSAHLLIMVFP